MKTISWSTLINNTLILPSVELIIRFQIEKRSLQVVGSHLPQNLTGFIISKLLMLYLY